MVRPPMPPTYFFAFDVSAQAVSSGFLAVAVQTIKETLDSLPGGERTRVGSLTYDSTLHFYALKPGSSQPQMMVVAELDDPLCPADDLLGRPAGIPRRGDRRCSTCSRGPSPRRTRWTRAWAPRSRRRTWR